MGWPAWYLQHDQPGTCYIEPRHFPDLVREFAGAGQAWKFRRQWTTYRPNRKIAFKNVRNLMPKSAEDFSNIMGSCEKAGLKPPTSFADIFLANYFPPFPRSSTVAPFRGQTFGGWQQVFWRGTYFGKVWHYDINKAYRWAACRGLPDLRTAYPTKDWRESSAIYLCGPGEDARPYCRGPGFRIITSEERDRFGIMCPEILAGVGFRETIELTGTFKKIDSRFPYCRDRISRVFWGMWNTMQGPEVCTWKNGQRVREMENPMYNPIWAYLITSRVKMRVAELLPIMLHCFVDSVLTKELILTGDQIGDWRLVDTFRTAWIQAPGIWGSREKTIKHCGLTRSA